MPAASGKGPRRSCRLRPGLLTQPLIQPLIQPVLGSPGRNAKLRTFTALETVPAHRPALP